MSWANAVQYPERLPRDEAHEAALAKQVREGEITALLKERSDVLAQREAARSRTPEKQLLIVDGNGRPVPGLFIQNVTAALDRERIEAEISRLDSVLELVDSELAARGHKPPKKGT